MTIFDVTDGIGGRLKFRDGYQFDAYAILSITRGRNRTISRVRISDNVLSHSEPRRR